MDLSLLSPFVRQARADLLQDYLIWSREEPRRLEEREKRLDQLCRDQCALLLAEDARSDTLKLTMAACPWGGRWRSKGLKKRTLMTTVTEVTWQRRYYQCSQWGSHFLPLDEVWGVEAGGCLSTRAQREAVDLATAVPFREARLWMERLTGVDVSLSTLWRATQKRGAALVSAEQDRLKEWDTEAGAAQFIGARRQPPTAIRPVLAVDGLLLRIDRRWREVKLAVLGQLSEKGDWVKGKTSYLATVEPADRFRQKVLRFALDRGITEKSALVIVSDGAEWIATLGRRYFPHSRHLIDYWHAKQYLWTAAHLLFGPENPHAAAFVEEVKGALWKGDVQEIQARVTTVTIQRKIMNKETLEELRKAMHYLLDRADGIRYAEFQHRGDPTGSGPAEGGCKAVVQSRMKRSGMNWSWVGAERRLALRANYCERLHALQ